MRIVSGSKGKGSGSVGSRTDGSIRSKRTVKNHLAGNLFAHKDIVLCRAACSLIIVDNPYGALKVILCAVGHMNAACLPHAAVLCQNSVFRNGSAVHIQPAAAFKLNAAATIARDIVLNRAFAGHAGCSKDVDAAAPRCTVVANTTAIHIKFGTIARHGNVNTAAVSA